MSVLAEKSFAVTGEKSGPTEDDMALINQFAIEPLAADEVYILRAHLANTRVDRSHEKFSLPVLERLADTIVGKPLLPGHDKSKVPLGKWFRSEIVEQPDGTHDLVTDSYVPRNSETHKLVRMGIASQVSIGFKADKRVCDIDGENFDSKKCKHNVGHDYDGKTCTVTWTGDVSKYEAREGSLVYLGCQYGAQVVGAKTAENEDSSLIIWKSDDFDRESEKEPSMKVLSEEEQTKVLAEREDRIKSLETENAQIKAQLADFEVKKPHFEAYVIALKGEVSRKAQALKYDPELVMATLEDASIETLKRWDTTLQAKFDEKFPPSPQAQMLEELQATKPGGRPRVMGSI